jgi:hypothetical protein
MHWRSTQLFTLLLKYIPSLELCQQTATTQLGKLAQHRTFPPITCMGTVRSNPFHTVHMLAHSEELYEQFWCELGA